jgi:flagellar biosynthetic protein FliR
LLISALVRSFELVPIAGIAMEGHAWLVLMRIGSIVFATGLLISLPIMAALLITNIALAILTRAAPQLNIFAIGFPITATVGLVTIMFSLPALSPVLIRLFDQGFELLGLFLKTLTPG